MITEWRRIAGIDGDYSVSDRGRVRNNHTGLILSDNRRNANGYPIYGLRSGGKVRQFFGHRLVAAAFLGSPTGPVVRHLDDVKHNNAVSNLAYGTQSDNMLDAVRNGSRGGRERWQKFCRQGHEMTPENQLWIKERDHPRCRTCKNSRRRESKTRSRERPAPDWGPDDFPKKEKAA